MRPALILLLVILAISLFAVNADRQRGKFVKEKAEKKLKAEEQQQEPTDEQKRQLQQFLDTATCEQCVQQQGLGWDTAAGKCSLQSQNKVCPQQKKAETLADKKKRLSADSEDDDEDEDEDETEDDTEDSDDVEDVESQSQYQHEQQQQPPQEMVFDDQWANTELTTSYWSAIYRGDMDALRNILAQYGPNSVIVRSQDGRGPLFWAYEYHKPEMVKLLIETGAREDVTDASGQLPKDLGV